MEVEVEAAHNCGADAAKQESCCTKGLLEQLRKSVPKFLKV
jgi:hypothetical protein